MLTDLGSIRGFGFRRGFSVLGWTVYGLGCADCTVEVSGLGLNVGASIPISTVVVLFAEVPNHT